MSLPRGFTALECATARFRERANAQPNGCWLWAGRKDKDGYGYIMMDCKRLKAHRFSYLIHQGPIPAGLFVLHNCPAGDNPSCVNPAHLWLGTNADNLRDMRAKGRQARLCGEDSPRHRLTDRLVAEILQLSRERGSRHISRRFGLPRSTVRNVISRKSWGHVSVASAPALPAD